jgi:hypothetical protein
MYEAGCQRGQGYYFAHAVAVEQVAEFIELGAFVVRISALVASAGSGSVES